MTQPEGWINKFLWKTVFFFGYSHAIWYEWNIQSLSGYIYVYIIDIYVYIYICVHIYLQIHTYMRSGMNGLQKSLFRIPSYPCQKTFKFHVNINSFQIRYILRRGLHPWKLTCPLKRDYFNRKYIFQPLIFRGHVSFPGSKSLHLQIDPKQKDPASNQKVSQSEPRIKKHPALLSMGNPGCLIGILVMVYEIIPT